MAIVEGTQVTDADITFWNYYMTRPSDGTDGARSNVVTSGDSGFAAIQVDELAGKIGAIVEPYDPEGRNRMIQEF